MYTCMDVRVYPCRFVCVYVCRDARMFMHVCTYVCPSVRAIGACVTGGTQREVLFRT